MDPAELISQALLEPTMDYSSRVPENFPVRKALSILHQLGLPITGQIRMHSLPDDPEKARRVRAHRVQAQMYVRSQEPNTIYVNDWVPQMRDAQNGNEDAQRKIAAALAHEQYHVSNGPDEMPAYDEQIRVLRQLGMRTGDVENSKRYVAMEKGLTAKK